MVALLKEELRRIPSKNSDGGENVGKLTNAQLLARSIVENAIDGNTTLAKDILDRLDGKVVQTVSGPGGGPLEISQTVKVIGQNEIKPALEALVECGVVQVHQN